MQLKPHWANSLPLQGYMVEDAKRHVGFAEKQEYTNYADILNTLEDHLPVTLRYLLGL